MGLISKLIGTKPQIGFWACDNSFQFVDPLINYLSDNGYKVQKYDYFGDDQLLKQQVDSVDIAWFEWGNGPIIPASNFETTTKIINRIHRYEVYSDAPRQINWSNVDQVIFSSKAMLEKFSNKFQGLLDNTSARHINIGVDEELFRFEEKPLGKNIIYTGRIHPHKNPSLLLQIYSAIHTKDSEYTLTVIGKFEDELYEEYFFDQLDKLGIKEAVDYHEHMQQADLVSYLQKSDHYLVTSIIEGLSQSSLEAMACGSRPVIFNYYGASNTVAYPENVIYNTVDQAVEKIMNPSISRAQSREIIDAHFKLADRSADIQKVIHSL